MSNTVNVIAARPLSGILKAIALEPPTWSRLEPQSFTGDPTPGIEARVHDPLWLIARQWQFGEFQGEDAGTPIAMHVAMISRRFSAWKPGNENDRTPARALGADHSIEPEVEREPSTSHGVGLRQRAEAGALLVSALAETGFDVGKALTDAFTLPVDEEPPADVPAAVWQADPMWRTIARASPDGEAVAASIEAAGAGNPAWLNGASADAIAASREWLAWYRSQVSRPAGSNDAWLRERLEYQFAVRAGNPDNQAVFRAPAHDGGPVDWYSFDYRPGETLAVEGEVADPAAEVAKTMTMLATPLRYAGMPADRLWQFEDGLVNFGHIEAQPHDLARLCFVEFSTVYGNDWYTIPVDLPAGSFTQFSEVAFTTTFGERFVVTQADDSGRSGHFRMFGLSVSGESNMLPGLLMPPGGRVSQEGKALEDVVFLRDESANMAWAVEKTVQGKSGDPRNRSSEPQFLPPNAPLADGADLRYILETTVPANWIPLVPIATSPAQGGFELRKGTMTNKDESLGEILHPTPFTLKEEEVPREGVRVRRVPAICRTADGQMVRWIARRVSVAHGEGASRLAFDGTTNQPGG
ncbi:hypothetical protein [Rhizobium rhizogenes]|uniref:hypothetical protein n=1 Tax=Rhizobium rhizogenes TaxID=359 RepID=UPI0004DA9012|nr:hypothetical protein [Rhizobium rhizogenes]KEA07731.1 hypothetical protein CN09_00690 [Rhizobium rhizogenes]MQB34173.1 hypothetical protein [Rhizobium rhizogenes]NTF72532.1 hypothetical protein [Rhizobium rhizogenes]NTI83309.1 hypothetical protein [Rhizobium rhizogenes]NTJ27261.1 hypothetical protein [Rhizobium rhizogenes]